MKRNLKHADSVIRNVNAYNSYFKRFYPADVYIKDGKFLYIDKKRCSEVSADEEIDGRGRYMIPGLIDIHMHIESSLVTPEAFCAYTARNGLTTIVSEPHEIANVCGKEGIRAMIESGKKSPYDCYYAIPSNVPIRGREFETSGGTITFEDMKELKQEEGIICLGEVMNYREVIGDDRSEVGSFIDHIHARQPDYPLEGHCPELKDSDLAAFAYRGILSDHCTHDLEELKQRFENGIFVQLQDVMVTQESIDFICKNDLYEYFSFVTDDTFPDVLCGKGHLDAIVRKAIALGMPPEKAIYSATFTPARRMNLLDRGVIAPGRLADFALLEDLKSLSITDTYKNGKCIFSIGNDEEEKENYDLDGRFEETIHSRKLVPDDFKIRIEGSDRSVNVRVMRLYPDNNRSDETFVKMEVKNSELCWKKSGCQLVMVVERHGRDNHIAYGFACGPTIRQGACASSYSHDSHNLIVMGNDEEDMMAAINRVTELHGGITVAKQGNILAEIALPIAGLLSKKSVTETAKEFVQVREAFTVLGYEHINNIMNFCLMSLTCIPTLKLTDRGYLNTKTFELSGLYEEIDS